MISVCKIDKNNVFVSSREIDEYGTWGSDELRGVIAPSGGGVFRWDGVMWEELESYPIEVPTEIRMAQCRAQLIIDGKDDDVELLLSGITDPIKQKLYRSYFEYEPVVKRDNAMINEMAPVLGIDLDAFFLAASKL